MPLWTEFTLAVLSGVLASSGFWAFIMSRTELRSAQAQMLRGLGHDRIIFLCDHYLQQGYISAEDYENLHDYLYEPYVKLKGNGSAERMMKLVDQLPVHN